MPGRKPAGPASVWQLQGSAAAKERLEVILETVAGRLSVQDACARLQLGATRVHVLRQQVLQAALASLEPQPLGRPPQPAPSAEVVDLRQRLAEQEVAARAAQVREEIALVLPHVGAAADREKKTRRRPPPRPSSRRRA